MGAIIGGLFCGRNGVMSSGNVSKVALWTGRVISALPVLALVMSAVMKLSHSKGVVEGFAKFGYPERLLTPIGIVELSCALLYVIPQTAVLGAILVTGYLGGATATHARLGDPMFVMPVVVGILAWVGLLLRERRLRPLLPFRF
jgi:hypothetical protein